MQENEIIDRIRSLCKARSWTYYRLAKESGITYSTLFTMLNKAHAPSLPTLIKICSGFGITVADFFDEGNDRVPLTDGQNEHLRQWDKLSPEHQAMVEKYMAYLLSEQNM